MTGINSSIDFRAIASTFENWIDTPGYPLEKSFPEEEYRLRLTRARNGMVEHELDALVITSSAVGHWFTSFDEPHEWHDQCQVRSAWYILTPQSDHLFMTPTAMGEHFNTTRRSTWVSQIRGLAERNAEPRNEIWDIGQIPGVLAELGLGRSRIGFELGQCMTLGLSVLDFLKLRELMPTASLVDGSAAIRRLMSVLTPFEINRLRKACAAGIWIHGKTLDVLKPGLREDQFQLQLAEAFRNRFGNGRYSFEHKRHWDVRNGLRKNLHVFHNASTERIFEDGDMLFRGASGVSYRGYHADIDRMWFIGEPPTKVLDLYKMTWECNRAMAESLRPGISCADVFAEGAKVERAFGLGPRPAGRTGHGYRNTGGLSVHPDCVTVLEPGMLISVEPMFADENGYFDLEDQYVITENGAECLHEPAPEALPIVGR